MNEQENKQKIKEETKKEQEVITPEQTGEVVQHEIEAPETTEEIGKEVPAEEKPNEEVVEVSDEMGQDDKDAGKESGENKADTEQSESDEGTADDASKEVQQPEEEVNEPVEEQEKEPIEETDIEAIKKELAELKAEREEEAKVKELVEVAQHVESEYDRVVTRINEALRETLEQYQIPTDKTIQELEKEDPAKAQIARNLITQAKQALDYNTQMLSNEYRAKEQDVIFSKAERLFNKYEMTAEEQQVAAETFIQILHASGLQDLKEDLAAKVELSVAQAKFRVPPKMVEKETSVQLTEVHTEPVVEPKKADEKVSEEEVSKPEEKLEEKAPEPSIEEIKLERGIAKEPVTKKVNDNLDAFKEGIDGSSSSASKTSTVDVTNVLSKLAALPPKERQRFTKENFALINAAMRDFNIKHSRKV